LSLFKIIFDGTKKEEARQQAAKKKSHSEANFLLQYHSHAITFGFVPTVFSNRRMIK
jgi:hypothetical protein